MNNEQNVEGLNVSPAIAKLNVDIPAGSYNFSITEWDDFNQEHTHRSLKRDGGKINLLNQIR